MRPFFTIIFLFIIYNLNSQITFNHRYHFDFPAATLTSVIPTDDGYFATGVIADSVPPFRTGNIFLKFDLEGNPIFTKTLTNSVKTYETWENTLIQLSDSTFMVSAYSFDSLGMSGLLIKLDAAGDTLFTKEYLNPITPYNFFRPMDFKSTEDGGFVFASWAAGEENFPYQNADFHILKVDSTGNKEWEKVLGNNHWDIPMSVIAKETGEIIVGGLKANLNLTTSNYTFRTQIIQLDNLGNEQWTYLSPTSIGLRDGARDMILLEDGSLVIASGVGTEYERASVNDVWYEKLIMKLDTAQNMVWEREFKAYHESDFIKTINLIRLNNESGYIMTGISTSENPTVENWGTYGWIGKISNSGDSIWTREYAFLNTNMFTHEIYDIKETPDKGFILCGQSMDVSGTDSIPQQAWLLKLDEHGCLVPGCHTSVNEIEQNPIAVSVYPNPTTDYVNLWYANSKFKPSQKAVFRLINAEGKLMTEFEIRQDDVTFILPVFDYPSGAYFLQLIVEDEVLKTEKIIIFTQ